MKEGQERTDATVAEDGVGSEWEIQAARNSFPSGLLQPKDSFRFSGDALLLAEFASEFSLPSDAAVADLGSGCGVVGLGLLLLRPDMPDWRVIGIEKSQIFAEAARANAGRLGLPGCTFFAGDIERRETLKSVRQQLAPSKSNLTAGGYVADGEALPLFDAVVCNPPWRVEGAGRLPPSPARRSALFGDESTFPLFFHAADRLLKPYGSLAVVCGAERLTDVLAALPPRLRPVRLRFLHASPTAPATFFLLEARKGSGASLVVEAPRPPVLLKNFHDTGMSRRAAPSFTTA